MKLLCTLLAVCIHFCLIGQSATIDSIVNLKPVLVSKIVKNYDNFNKIYITSAFAEDEIKDTIGMGLIRANKIIKVELVYTQYRQSETFQQKALNKVRLENLNRILPYAFEPDVRWVLLEQTKATDTTQAIQYFHGFIITIMPAMEIPFTGSETAYVDSVFEKITEKVPPGCFTEFQQLIYTKKLPSAPVYGSVRGELKTKLTNTIVFPEIKRRKNINGTIVTQLYVSEYGSIDSFTIDNRYLDTAFTTAVYNALQQLGDFNKSKFISGKAQYSFKIRFRFYADGNKNHQCIVTVSPAKLLNTCPRTPATELTYDISTMMLYDSTVLNVMDRHKEWEEMLVVADLTGSMSPYVAQILLWYQLMLYNNENKVNYFCFFNDGNNKPDFAKIKGSTGGIYLGEAGSIQDVKQMVQTTMKNGSGGDGPENNVEALIAALKKYPDAETIVMIADNYATPRDMELLGKVNKPVKIILCGTNYGINIDYLNFAKVNKGSIYTIDQDIENLAAMVEGDRIVIDGITYQIVGGKFQRVIIN